LPALEQLERSRSLLEQGLMKQKLSLLKELVELRSLKDRFVN
jgi:hypothetical protein